MNSKRNFLFAVSSKCLMNIVIKEYVHTITSDNGSEFARHEEISVELNVDFFFAHPYSSWERGLNENTNGLVRQYLKKGSEFNAVTDHDLAIIVSKLNSRPRKHLVTNRPMRSSIDDGDKFAKYYCSYA